MPAGHKRPLSHSVDVECLDYTLDRSTWCGKTKRIESYSDLAPSVQPAATPEALAFLDSLTRASASSLGQQGSELFWLCIADLNLLMAHNFSQDDVPSCITLKSLHSFTRTNKLLLWERILASSGLASLDQHVATPTAGFPVHLQMLNACLMKVLAAYPEAAIIKYTFLVPPWLFGWSCKWGFAGQELCVLAVHAYHPDLEASSMPVDGQQTPTRCIYIPVFSQ